MKGQEAKTQRNSLCLLAEELSISIAQTAIFFFIAMFSSNFLRDSAALAAYANQKINGTTFPEFFLSLLSILVVSGVLFFLLAATKESPACSRLPRTCSWRCHAPYPFSAALFWQHYSPLRFTCTSIRIQAARAHLPRL